MALTIAIEGEGVIANCDAISDTAGGTWFELGGGTIALSEDVYLIGGASIGGKYAGKSGIQAIDKGSALYNFTGGGSHEGQLIYIWIAMTAIGTLTTKAGYGLCVRVSSGSSSTASSNYVDFTIAGSDDANGWTGSEWRCFVVDPTMTPSRYDGTIATILANVRSIGVWIDCSGSARADSIFIGGIAIGSGLRITGTSTQGWKDVADYCTAYATRGWGMFQKREGIYFTYGKTYIGDAVSQSAAVSFTDTDRIIQFGTSEYWTGSAWVSFMPADASGIVIEDHASYTTTFSDGTAQGSDGGIAGSVIIGNALLDVSLDLFGGNHADSVTTLYGTTLKNITGPINSGDDGNHKFYSVTYSGCAQFDPVGGPVIRNCIFLDTADVDAALLWNASANVQDCSFIANTTGAAIEHPNSGGFGYTDMLFAGNTYDILNSIAAGVLVDSYDTGSNDINMATGSNIALSQSFQNVTQGYLSMAKFYLVKTGSPTGNIVAKLYAHSGTFGTSSIPTGTALAESEPIDVSGLTGSYVLTEFDFGDRYQMAASTYYTIVLEYSGGGGGDSIYVQYNISGGHSGNLAYYVSSWIYSSSQDLKFFIYRDGEVIVNATDSNPSAYEESGTNTTTVVVSSVDITITVQDENKNLIENAQTSVQLLDAPYTQLMNEDTTALGVAIEPYGGSVPVDVVVKARKSEGTDDPRYFAHSSVQEISASGLTLLVTLKVNPFI